MFFILVVLLFFFNICVRDKAFLQSRNNHERVFTLYCERNTPRVEPICSQKIDSYYPSFNPKVKARRIKRYSQGIPSTEEEKRLSHES